MKYGFVLPTGDARTAAEFAHERSRLAGMASLSGSGLGHRRLGVADGRRDAYRAHSAGHRL